MLNSIDPSRTDNLVSPANRNDDDYRDCINHALLTGGIVPYPRSDRERQTLAAAFPEVAAAMLGGCNG